MSAPTAATQTAATQTVATPAGAAAAVGDVDRYPGAPPFRDSELDRLLFRGRASETDEVLHSILSYDLFLVYAVSGMGKTSLLTAGVLEPLRERGYFPVMLRVNSPETPMLTLIESQIRQAAAAAGVEVERAPTVSADAPAAETLWDLLAELEIWRGNTLQELVLVFDQFEELFTLPWSLQERAAFIEQFGEVVRHHRVPGRDTDPARQALPPPNVKIVMCMREDFIGQLEDLAVSVPQIMNRRFRLGGLDPKQAEAAIREPAALDDPRLRTHRFSYSDGAVGAILTFLRTKDERGETVMTESIDPSQLQIICQYIERTILPGKTPAADGLAEITESDLGGVEGLRRIVGDFYRHVLETFETGDRKALRHLCETGLISQSGRRLSLEEGEITAHFAVSGDTLRKLVDLRLLRSEPRVGSVYYELAHDTLTGPILAYRDARRRERRRRLLIATLIVALVAAVVAIVIVALRGGPADVVGAPPAIPLEIGKQQSAELSSGDDTAAYEVSAAPQPLLVDLHPVGFDGVLEVSTLGGTGASQTQDVGFSGADEFAVIGPGTGRYRIEVSGSGPGKFDLLARPATSRQLSLPADTNGIRLATTGEPTVFELAGAADQAFAVSVTAQKGQAASDVPRGSYMQITAPDGATTQSRGDDTRFKTDDDKFKLSGLGGGSAGTYLIAIGDASGGTKTTYDIEVTPVGITPVAIGQSAEASLTTAEPRTVFEVQSASDGALIFQLRDQQGGTFGEVQTPDGAIFDLDSTTLSVVSGTPGRYLAFVTSDSPDVASLSVDSAEGVAVGLGEKVHGVLDGEHAAALFRVTAPGNGALVAQATSDGTLDAVLSLVSIDDSSIEPVDVVANDATEHLVLPNGLDGSQLLVVTPYAGSSGAFDFSVGAADVEPLAIGDTVERHLDSGDVALFAVDATGTSPFGVAVISTTSGSVASVDVIGPGGEAFTQSDNIFISSGDPGTYTIIARNDSDPGDFSISVDSLHDVGSRTTGAASGTIRGPGDVEMFALPLDADPKTFITVTTDGDLVAEATITDPSGNVIVYPDRQITGSDNAVFPVPAGSERMIIDSVSGSGTVNVRSSPIATTDLVPGQVRRGSIRSPGQVLAYDITVVDDAGLQVVATPSIGFDVQVAVLDPAGGFTVTDGDTEGSAEVGYLTSGAGNYIILVDGAGESTGDFQLSTEPTE